MSDDLLRHVDPFYGVDEGGNCLCGPHLPFGLVRPGPDIVPPQPTNGFRSGKPLLHFSQTHVSGTGGGGRFGNIGLLPLASGTLPDAAGYALEEPAASPGFFAATLGGSGIRVESTCTQRTACYRLRFPAGSGRVLLRTGAVVCRGRAIGGHLQWADDQLVLGYADLQGGWGQDLPYRIHFAARFSRAATAIRSGSEADPAVARHASGTGAATLADFDVSTLEVRIGISHVSVAQARASLDAETGGRSFDEIHATARGAWQHWLSTITVEGGSDYDTRRFYSLFARLVCMPSDCGVDGNPLWNSGRRQFEGYYALWDSVRNANTLIGFLWPDLAADLLNNLIDIADHTGWMPDAWIAFQHAYVQGGISADQLFSEAFRRGLGGVDYGRALDHLLRHHREQHPEPGRFGRYLDEYRRLGYCAESTPHCVSRTVEYALHDWCLARLAEGQGRHGLVAELDRTAGNLWNLWRDDLKCFAPRHSDGSWIAPFNPSKPSRPDYWNDPHCYEGVGHEWALAAVHVLPELIRRHGGPAGFVAHLDRFFAEYFFDWKEMVVHTPYLYHLVGRPDRSAETLRRMMEKYFLSGPKGIKDNEDMGAQSAFFVASAIGLYPFMGHTSWFLTAPRFARTVIRRNGAEPLTILAPGAADGLRYVQAVSVDGRDFPANRIEERDLRRCRWIEFQLGDRPGSWGMVV